MNILKNFPVPTLGVRRFTVTTTPKIQACFLQREGNCCSLPVAAKRVAAELIYKNGRQTSSAFHWFKSHRVECSRATRLERGSQRRAIFLTACPVHAGALHQIEEYWSVKISAEIRRWLNDPWNVSVNRWPVDVLKGFPGRRVHQCFLCEEEGLAATMVITGPISVAVGVLFNAAGIRYEWTEMHRLLLVSCPEHMPLFDALDYVVYRRRRRSLAAWKIEVLTAIGKKDARALAEVHALIAEGKLKEEDA